MATDTASGTAPALTDRGRWDGDVTAQVQFVYRWGTYAFRGELQAFADGEGYVRLRGPIDPPRLVEEIVAGGLAGSALARNVAAVLADRWAVAVDELDDAPPATVEPVGEVSA